MYAYIYIYIYIYTRQTNILFFIKNFGKGGKEKGTKHISGINLLIKRSLWSRVALLIIRWILAF